MYNNEERDDIMNGTFREVEEEVKKDIPEAAFEDEVQEEAQSQPEDTTYRYNFEGKKNVDDISGPEPQPREFTYRMRVDNGESSQNSSYSDNGNQSQNSGYSNSGSQTQNNSYSGSDNQSQSNSYAESSSDSYSEKRSYYSNNDNSNFYGNNNGGNRSYYSGNNKGNKEEKPLHFAAKAVIAGLIVGIIGGGLVLGAFAVGNRFMGNSNGTMEIESSIEKLETTVEKEPETDKPVAQASSSGYTVSDIAEKCRSSVVAITTISAEEVQTFFGKYISESEGSGSGVITAQTDKELQIVTNYHVVKNATQVTVCFNDDAEAVVNANIKGCDENNDLALVSVNLSDIPTDVLKTLTVAAMGDSDTLKVGDDVVAIGNALGCGQSVTAGIVSAVNRDVQMEGESAKGLIQTDAAINPGNSGGALFNMKGELVGINSSKYASEAVEGMGFAIPITKASSIITNLSTKETRVRLEENSGFLNIKGTDVSETDSQKYGIPQGVYIVQLVEGGAAANAEMQVGDIVVRMDGYDITCINDLKNRLQYYAAGETVDVVVSRNSGNGYEEVTLSVTLDNIDEQQQTTETEEESAEQEAPQTQEMPFFFPQQ